MKLFSKINEATVWPVLVVVASIISACTLFVIGSSFLESIMIDNPVSPQESGGFKIWLIDKLVFLSGIAGVAIYAQKKLHENTVRRDSRDIHIEKYEKIIGLLLSSRRDILSSHKTNHPLAALERAISKTQSEIFQEIESIVTSFDLPITDNLEKAFVDLSEKRDNSYKLRHKISQNRKHEESNFSKLELYDCAVIIDSFIEVIKDKIKEEKYQI